MKTRALVIGAVMVMGLGVMAWAQQPAPQLAGPMGPAMMGPPGGGMMMGGQGQPGMHGMPGMMMGGMGMGLGMMGMGRMNPRGGAPAERPLISIILEHREGLNLTAEQEQKLRAIRADYEKDALRQGAEVRVAEVDLRESLAGEAPDLGKVEAEVKKIAAMQGELRFRRIRALEAGKAVLAKEQRQQLDRLMRQHPMMGGGMMGGGMGHGMMMGPAPRQ